MLILLFFVSLFSIPYEPDCFVASQFLEGEEGEIVELGDYIQLTTYFASLSDYTGKVTTDSLLYFDSREDLKNLYNCNYTFSTVPYAARGYIKKLNIINGQESVKLDLINVQSEDNVLLAVDDGLWLTEIAPCGNTTNAYKLGTIDTTNINIFAGYPEDYEQPQVLAPQFEFVSETVLVKEEGTVLEIIPAQFEIVTEQVLVQESNLCQELPTIYEERTEPILVKEASTMLTLVPAVYETVTEQVLSMDSYVEILTERPLIVSDSVEELLHLPLRYVNKNFIFEDCHPFTLDSCIAFETATFPRKDTTLMVDRYTCLPDYLKFENVCYKEYEIPAQYSTRSYEKLVTPVTTESTEIPAIYGSRSYIIVSNKDELPDSCIQTLYAPRQYEKLVSDATISIVSEIPAIYETRTYEKLVQNARLQSQDGMATYHDLTRLTQTQLPVQEVVPSMDSIFYNNLLMDTISSRLLSLGYDHSNYFENYIQYLCDENIPISIPTVDVLESLEIDISTLPFDTNVSTIPLLNYFHLVADNDEQIPIFIHYNISDPNCQNQTYSITSNDLIFEDPPILNIYGGTEIIGKVRSSYQESEKLYFIDLDTGEEHLLYDLSITDCDQKWPVTHLGPDTIWLDIRQIFETLDGRKVIELDIPLNDCETGDQYLQFIEGIGTNAGLIYDIQDGKVTTKLRCAVSNLGLIYTNPQGEGCNSITSIHNPEIKEPSIYPNPTTGNFTIPSDYRCLMIWNNLGKPIQFKTMGNEVDFTPALKGVYTIRLISSTRTIDMKVVKI